MKFSLKTLLFVLAFALAPQAAAQGQGNTARPAAEDFALERRSEAESKAVVSLCLTSGDVIVRGWERG